MNEVMKVLTILASIFIPLTFLTGVYGMNFIYIPILSEPWGFWVIAAIMVAIAIGMIYYFKKKKWLK